MDVVAVKGKTIGVSVYEILSRKDDTRNAELHDKIVETYERTSTARQPTRESFCLPRHTQNATLGVYRWV